MIEIHKLSDTDKIVASNLTIAAVIASGGNLQTAPRNIDQVIALYAGACKHLSSFGESFFAECDLS